MTTITPTRTPDRLSAAERLLARVAPERRAQAIVEFVDALPAAKRDALPYTWSFWSRPQQQPPPGRWRVWVVRAGRGFGKTRTGAEVVRERVRAGQAGHITLIAPTAADVRDVMIEGESGLLAVHPPHWRPEYEPSKRRVTWPNGATALCFSAEEPERLRGPQSDLIWGDEPGSWKSGSAAFDNASLGNRLGVDPVAVLTMTPRTYPWLRDIEARTGTVVTTGSTYENITNLAETFIDLIVDRYEGTRLGRQELHAEYLEDVEGALWSMQMIEEHRMPGFDVSDRHRALQVALMRSGRPLQASPRQPWVTYVGVDPPGETAECGIVVGTAPRNGRASRDHAVILDDLSLAGPPEVWGARVVEAVNMYAADAVYVESNQGGDMVRAVIHAQDPTVTVHKVRAKESKYDRAEPISVLYARGWVHHAGYLGALESQLTTWVPTEGKSPDRLDALVHLVTALLRPVGPIRSSVGSPAGRRIAG